MNAKSSAPSTGPKVVMPSIVLDVHSLCSTEKAMASSKRERVDRQQLAHPEKWNRRMQREWREGRKEEKKNRELG